MSITTFGVYAASGNEVTASVVFPAIGLFAILRFPLTLIPMVFASVIKMLIGAQRVADFVIAEEIQDRDAGMYGDRQKTEGGGSACT